MGLVIRSERRLHRLLRIVPLVLFGVFQNAWGEALPPQLKARVIEECTRFKENPRALMLCAGVVTSDAVPSGTACSSLFIDRAWLALFPKLALVKLDSTALEGCMRAASSIQNVATGCSPMTAACAVEKATPLADDSYYGRVFGTICLLDKKPSTCFARTAARKKDLRLCDLGAKLLVETPGGSANKRLRAECLRTAGDLLGRRYMSQFGTAKCVVDTDGETCRTGVIRRTFNLESYRSCVTRLFARPAAPLPQCLLEEARKAISEDLCTGTDADACAHSVAWTWMSEASKRVEIPAACFARDPRAGGGQCGVEPRDWDVTQSLCAAHAAAQSRQPEICLKAPDSRYCLRVLPMLTGISTLCDLSGGPACPDNVLAFANLPAAAKGELESCLHLRSDSALQKCVTASASVPSSCTFAPYVAACTEQSRAPNRPPK